MHANLYRKEFVMRKTLFLCALLSLFCFDIQAKKVYNRYEIGNDSVSTRVLVRDSVWVSTLAGCRRGDTIVVTVGASEYNDQDKARHSSIEEMEMNLLQMGEEAKKKHVNLVLIAPEGPYIGGYGEGVKRVEERLTRKK